jgi:cysteinyl-tRNA synthetase
MDDDLNTSGALAVVHDAMREGNAALAAGDAPATTTALGDVRGMLDALGLDPASAQWADRGESGGLRGVVDALVALALEQRTAARTRKDWSAADAVRDQLKQAGVTVEDTSDGPRWTVEGR